MNDPEGRPVDHQRLMREAIRNNPAAGPADAAPPLSPEQLAPHLPDFEIQGLLGRGGMGAVYKAVQRKLDRVVALKVLSKHLATDPEFGERFHREARALASLNHPHVLTVHDFGESEEFYFLVTEFVDGLNLRQLMALGHLSPAEALRITPQICTALQYAHEHGVVHRDVKPENILIDTAGQVKIADFGLAKLLRPGDPVALTRSTAVFGTPHYMAPEQWRASGTVDHRADIYALGVVLYEMLTGELPIGHFDPPSMHEGVPRGLDQVVQRALAQQPENRYQHARDVQTDVELQGRSAPRAPRSGSVRAATSGGRPVAGPFVALGLVLLCAALAFALVVSMQVGQADHFRGDVQGRNYDATVTAMAATVRDGREWTGGLPEWPGDARPAPVSVSLVKTLVTTVVPTVLLLVMVLGFASVRRIRNSGGALRGMPLAVFTAWLVPIGAVVGVAFAPIAAIRSNDTQILAGIVLAIALGCGAVWFLHRETRRQRALIASGVGQPGGVGLLVAGSMLAFVIFAGGVVSSLFLHRSQESEVAETAPVVAADLIGRTAAFVLERLGPPSSLTASTSGQSWGYADPKGAVHEDAVVLSGDHVLAVDPAVLVLMPNARPTGVPFLGQSIAELTAAIGSPSSRVVGALGVRLEWPDGLRVSSHDGRVVGFRRD